MLTAAVFYERPVVSSISVLSIAIGAPVYLCREIGRLAPIHLTLTQGLH